MGDLNDLKTDEICDTCKLHQIVKVHTRDNATLDQILTNTNNEVYNDPIQFPKIGGSYHFSDLYKPLVHKKVKAIKKEKNHYNKIQRICHH